MTLEKISGEIVHQNPWWSVHHDVYRKADGTTGDYYYGANPGFGFSLVVPMNDEGKIILVRQYRYLKDAYSIEFPGGGIDEGENPLHAAQRELKEEIGYEAGELIAVGTFESSCGLLKDEGHVFVARNLERIEGKQDEPTGMVEIMARRPDEFDDMVQRGEIWNGVTLAAWMLVRKNFLT